MLLLLLPLQVDPDCSKGGVKVYVDAHNLAYNAVCNQFDIQTGVNKFWKIQLLVGSAKRPKYCIFRSWGRVGGDEEQRGHGRGPQTGGDLVHEHGEGEEGLRKALKEFHDQFRQKCSVAFLACKPPCQHPGGYNVALLAGQGAEDAADVARQAAASGVAAGARAVEATSRACTLPAEVAEFVSLIHSEKMMQEQLREANIDLDKMPLGSISDTQVHAGYKVLRDIADRLATPLPNPEQQALVLMALSNKFYNTIPHKFDRASTPPIIETVDQLRAKSDMVESLLSVSQATIAKQLGAAEAQAEHPTDVYYRRLGCGLEPASEEEVAMVVEYAAKTHAATHNSYRLKVKHVFRAAREGEASGFKERMHALGLPTPPQQRRMLLWHGSRLTNWVGILSKGLRIAPPEAPMTGYMFGKGVYFADMVSKSANYCMGSSANPTCVLTLCDVALGQQAPRTLQPCNHAAMQPCSPAALRAGGCSPACWRLQPHAISHLAPSRTSRHLAPRAQYERLTAEYEAAERTQAAKKHSCWGVGKTAPAASGTRTLASGAQVPMGKGGPNQYLEDNVERLKAAEGVRAPGLMYNEFIVYDTAQVEMKYVVVFDMDFSIELD